MAGEVRYTTTSDGVRIAYAVSGDGPPLLLLPAIYASFSLMHELPWYDDFMRRVSEGRTLIRYDQRGTGLSQREVEDVRNVAMTKDVEAVLDALGLERASLLAGGPLGSVAIWFAASRSERVAALVVFGTSARLRDTNTGEVVAALGHLARNNWETLARTLASMSLRRPPEEATKLASIYMRSVTGAFVARHMEGSLGLDLSGSLGDITARTLVMHPEADGFYPFAGGQEMAAQIPNARLLPLEGNLSLTTLGDKTEMVTDAIKSFLDEDPETRRLTGAPKDTGQRVRGQSSSMAVIMFADIADSTGLTERLGDVGFRDRARDLEKDLARAISGNYGTAIEGKLLGDGVLALFTNARQAIEGALACLHAGNERGLPLHLGLHAGDVIRESDNVYGGAVNIAARISGLSAPGEVLVSRTVADLARTSSGVTFEDRGERELKGVAEPQHVFAVRKGGG
jgi:class 3 adenylate cyclase